MSAKVPETIEIPVEMLTPAQAAAELGVGERQLRNLETKGLPCRGDGRAKRYAWPLVWEWYAVYRDRYERGGRKEISYLDPAEASRAYGRRSAILRAWHRLRSPELYVESAPLDREAERQLGYAQALLAAGRHPEDLPL